MKLGHNHGGNVNAIVAIAHPGHDHFKLDDKSGLWLWLPIALVGVLVTLMLVQVLRTWRRQ